jgi:hypothetical protein
MESTQKIWVRSRRARLRDRAEMLRIQYFERNPQAFLPVFLILVELRVSCFQDASLSNLIPVYTNI